MRKWTNIGKKQKNYKMKNIKLLVFISLLGFLTACKMEPKLNDEFFGHYVNKAYLDSLKANKNFYNNNLALQEFVFKSNDSTGLYFEISKTKKNIKYEPVKNDLLVIKDFFGLNVNAELRIVGKDLELRNLTTDERTIFTKINQEDLKFAKEMEYVSYAIPYCNNILFSGLYLINNTDTLEFTEKGQIKGYNDFVFYSLCHTMMCREFNQSNTLFLSKKNNEGDTYEFEFKNDSLFIYQLDMLKALNREKSERIKTVIAAKKI